MRTAVFVFAAVVAAGAPAAPAAERVVTIPTRPGVTVKVVVDGAAGARAPIVVLFAGHNGIVGLDSWDGSGSPTRNFLVRSRKLFADLGLVTVVPDAPSDRQTDGLFGWRTSKAHGADIAAVIAYVRRYSKGPVVLVGTSRGSISAAAGAAQLPPGVIAGAVLTSTVTRTNRARNRNQVQDANLAAVRVPVLLAHHRDDACFVTPFEDIGKLARAFTAAPKVAIKSYDGGGNYRGPLCGARTAHGFRGIERQVVTDIAAWIKGVASAP